MEHKLDANRDIDADGRDAFTKCATAARSGIEPVDHHDLEEKDFLAQVSKRLDELVTAGKVHHLVIVAPPRALGAIRKTYSPAVRAAIRAEIDQDLVKMPVAEIQDEIRQSAAQAEVGRRMRPRRAGTCLCRSDRTSVAASRRSSSPVLECRPAGSGAAYIVHNF